MALTYGFFNSENHDRLYSAEDMAGFLDGIIYDGVYQAVGNKFEVKPYSDMKVSVDSGRAWFDHTWIRNTTKYIVELDAPDTVYDRIDAVVIEINKSDRKNYIKVVKGTPAANPQKPALMKSNMVKQYALAYITVIKQSTDGIADGDIEYVVGKPQGTASRWVYNLAYQKNDTVVSSAGNIYVALKNVPAGTDLTDTEYWKLQAPAETPLVSALALSGIPSGGTVGQILAKTSDESGAIGWFNINRLPSGKWYLPQGVTEDDVVAAYKFRYAEDLNEALMSVNGNSIRLTATSNVAWSGADGIKIPALANQGLDNSNLRSSSMGTVAVKYANADVNGSKQIGLIYKNQTHFILARYYAMVGQYRQTPGGSMIDAYQNIKRPVIAAGSYTKTQDGYTGQYYDSDYGDNACYYSQDFLENKNSGILACDFSATSVSQVKLWSSGNSLSMRSARLKYSSQEINSDQTTWTKNYAAGAPNLNASSTGPLIGNCRNLYCPTFGSVNIHLVVFYNRALSENEIISLHNMMADI